MSSSWRFFCFSRLCINSVVWSQQCAHLAFLLCSHSYVPAVQWSLLRTPQLQWYPQPSASPQPL